jgi:hypothetical protein
MPTTKQLVSIPYKLSFVPGTGGLGRGAQMKPGRGEAGWTVTTVPAAQARATLAALPPESWMPGTHRVAAQLG